MNLVPRKLSCRSVRVLFSLMCENDLSTRMNSWCKSRTGGLSRKCNRNLLLLAIVQSFVKLRGLQQRIDRDILQAIMPSLPRVLYMRYSLCNVVRSTHELLDGRPTRLDTFGKRP